MQHALFLIAVSLIIGLGACATTDSPELTGQGVSAAALQHNQEGMKHYKVGHWEIAKQHFEAASKADPDLAEPHYNLGLALHKMGPMRKPPLTLKRRGSWLRTMRPLQDHAPINTMSIRQDLQSLTATIEGNVGRAVARMLRVSSFACTHRQLA